MISVAGIPSISKVSCMMLFCKSVYNWLTIAPCVNAALSFPQAQAYVELLPRTLLPAMADLPVKALQPASGAAPCTALRHTNAH
jgi:hypothetical protein